MVIMSSDWKKRESEIVMLGFCCVTMIMIMMVKTMKMMTASTSGRLCDCERSGVEIEIEKRKKTKLKCSPRQTVRLWFECERI